MDYTKILSALIRVKNALEEKIDAINTSVSGLPDTLDSKFNTLAGKVDAVKSDVANVGGKVDGVKSDVAETAKSTELSVLNNSLSVEIKKSYLDLTKAQYKEIEFKKKAPVDIISVVGSGEIYLIGIGGASHTVQVKVEVDGVTECFIVSIGNDTGFVYEGILRGAPSSSYIIHSFGYCFTNNNNILNYDLYKIKEIVTNYFTNSARLLIKREPLKFNKSLKISVVEPIDSGSNDTFECKIAYSLN